MLGLRTVWQPIAQCSSRDCIDHALTYVLRLKIEEGHFCTYESKLNSAFLNDKRSPFIVMSEG